MITIKYSTEESVIDSSKKLMLENVFFGYFLASLNKVCVRNMPEEYRKQIPTAAVGKDDYLGGYKLYINDDFWETLTYKQRLAILLHELYHIMFFHPTMSDTFAHQKIFNIAADLEINQHITDLPDCGMSLKDYIEYMEKAKDDINSGKIPSPTRPCRLEDFGFKDADKHRGSKYYYDQLMAKMNDPKDQQGQQLKRMVEGMEDGVPYPCSHETWKEFEGMSKEEKEVSENQIKSMMKRIIEEGKITDYGNIPGQLRELITSLFIIRPPVYNWKTHFKRMVAKSMEYLIKSTRIKPNRRMEEDNPTIKFDPKMNIVSFLDTSGSMSDNDIIQCYTEVNHFYKTGHSIYVGETDCSFNEKTDYYQYTGTYPKTRGGISGGGGTSCDPALTWVKKNEKNISVVIYLTDGYMSPPTTKINVPIIWVITKTGADPLLLRKAGFYGTIIKMNDDC